MAVYQTLALSQNGQSVEGNYSKVRIWWITTQTGQSYNNYLRTAYYYVSVNDGPEEAFAVNYRLPQGVTGNVILDTTIQVPHRTDGTGKVSVRTWMDTDISAGVLTMQETLTLDTIPRKSTLTVGNGTLATEQTMTINRAATSFKHRLTYKCGDVAGYIAGSPTEYTTGTSIKWTPPIGLAAENTTGTSVLITLTLYTYTADGAHVGTTETTISCAIPVTVKPSCTISVEDVSGLLNRYGAAVQGLSKLKITVNAQTSQSAPISYYEISANGAKYNTSTVTTEALTTAGANKIAATVKDTRGRTGSNSANVEVLPYASPFVSALTVHRCDEDGSDNDQGEFVRAVFSCSVSPLSNKNSAVYSLKYKKTTEGSYTEIQFPALNDVYAVASFVCIFAADGNASYDVEVVAVDNHGTASRATSVSTAFTLMNWHQSGTGMGIGKVSEIENAVEFGLEIYDKDDDIVKGVRYMVNLLLPVGSIVLRYDTKNPSDLYPGTTWTQITARILRAGSVGSIGAEGTIADGSGRTYIDVAVWRRTA